jgi:Family of unknown function (DUF5681)
MARFTKGQSGNPGGRPKVIGEVRDLAQAHTAEAIDTLVAIMADEKAPPAARVAASNSILDRGYGRPAQTVNTALEDKRTVTELSYEELVAIAATGLRDLPENRTEQETDEELLRNSREKTH